MDIGAVNKQYWKKYLAGSTPAIDEVPSQAVLDRLPPRAKVLDIGTGGGLLAEALAATGLNVFGIDINPHEIEADIARQSSVSYSLQDITEGTNFPNDSFDLTLFRFTLTSIHRPQWSAVTKEIGRIAASDGYVWLAEPLVNDAYRSRYELAAHKLNDQHAVYVFKDKDKAAQVTSLSELDKALAADEVSRIVRHYTEEEVTALFPDFKVISVEHTEQISPSGYSLPTLVMLLQKAS